MVVVFEKTPKTLKGQGGYNTPILADDIDSKRKFKIRYFLHNPLPSRDELSVLEELAEVGSFIIDKDELKKM